MKEYTAIFKDKTKKDIRNKIIRILKQFPKGFGDIKTEFYGRENQHHLVFKMEGVDVDYYIEDKENPVNVYCCEDFHPDTITQIYFAFSEELGNMVNFNMSNFNLKKYK